MQGVTQPDDPEANALLSPGARSVTCSPPAAWSRSCRSVSGCTCSIVFDPEYIGGGRGQLGILWPRYSAAVFPNRSSAGIADVQRTLRRLLVVRNRVMHYERIAPWDDYSNTALHPGHVRNDILELLGWMSTRAATTLRDHGPPDYYLEPAFGRYLRLFACRP